MPDFLADLLSKPENAYYNLIIRTALTWGMSPMEAFIPQYKRDELEGRLDLIAIGMADIKLKIAYQILKEEVCPTCGTPTWLGHSTDRNIGFHVKSSFCYACSDVDDYRKKHPHEDVPGRNFYPVPYTYTGEPLPTRADFLSKVGAGDG